MNLDNYKRTFIKPIEPLQDLFIQILLFQYNFSTFNVKDWKEVALAYGQIFYKFEEVWEEVATPYKGLSRKEIVQQFSKKSLSGYFEDFKEKYEITEQEVSRFKYDLVEEGYISFIDLNNFEKPNDVNAPIYSVFNAFKATFSAVENEPRIWVFNGIDIQKVINSLTNYLDQLFYHYIIMDVFEYLEEWVEYSEQEALLLYHKTKSEKEALTTEIAHIPEFINFPIDRVIYLIDSKYRKRNGDRLNKDSIRRAFNRLKGE